MKVISIKNLEKTYDGKVPVKALRGINLEVEKGEMIAIMGPSGSGKSTFLNVISTIDKPTKGSVRISGKNPHKMNDEELASFRRNTLGFVFQNFNLLPTLTIEENIMLPMTLEKVPTAEMKHRTVEIAKLLGIANLLKKRTYEISGGQAQRTAVARAVVQDPALLLADEPTGNLDSKAAKDVMELFGMLNKVKKTTVLMVTHDALVASYCRKVYIIKDGRIYQEIIKEGDALEFQEEILNAMTLLGGGRNDII
ncbi:MAG: ABC transporter ATP-binding protein [Hespellia sp.]|nr:ABC transporter ATP-binding protein [Hespellia sp.]